MLSFTHRLSVSPSSSWPWSFVWGRQWLGAGMAVLVLAAGGTAAEQPAGDFGEAIKLAPFVVKGRSLAVSIHARTKGDRRYGEKFAEEVVEIAYETLGDSTGKGLVIVGADGEPHPIYFFRKFLEMSRAGRLDPSLAEAAAEVDGMLKKVQEKFKKIDEDPADLPTGITFDTFVPAMPLPLKGAASKLYQLAWAEGFDAARVEQMLKTLTRDELSAATRRPDATGETPPQAAGNVSVFKRYDWVFYLPPHSTTSVVLKEVMEKGMKAKKIGLIKRAAIRSAAFTFRPAINKAVEGMRKGMLFRAILIAESKYSEGDIDALSASYMNALMPDLKPGSIGEHRHALEAIEKQKIANAEYAKDPFVKPARLATFDPAAYAPFEGEYTKDPKQTTHRFKREGDDFQWNYKQDKPRVFYPAGDRLLVNEDGSMTIQFLVDDTGAVTGVEERRVRRRQTIPRKP